MNKFVAIVLCAMTSACATTPTVSTERVFAQSEPVVEVTVPELPSWITQTKPCSSDESGEVQAIGVTAISEDEAHGFAISAIIECLRGGLSLDEMEVVELRIIPQVRKSYTDPVSGQHFVLASTPQSIY